MSTVKQSLAVVRPTSGDLSNLLFFSLYQCTNMLHKTGTRALESTRITTQQWAVLGALSRAQASKGMAVGDLAAFLMVSRQNLTGLLSRMETLKMVERTINQDDSRSRLIKLTKHGEHIWQNEMQVKIATFYEEALAGFSLADKAAAIGYLDRLLGNFRKLEAANNEAPQ